MVEDTLRYKDRGSITYRIIQGFDGEQDCLELKYVDNEKTYEWDYYFDNDGKSALEHVTEISYEALKDGFIKNIRHHGYYMQKGEYQLLKESIVIFVSHKRLIIGICKANGLC
jgi:hypothetical protein